MTRAREENAMAPERGDAAFKTKAVTIAALIVEFFETHIQKCAEFSNEPDHVVSEFLETSAKVNTIGNTSIGNVQVIDLALDDGTAFTIRVEGIRSRPIPARP